MSTSTCGEKWFNSKVNQKFSQGLSFSQTPKILIITELSNENFDLALSLRKNNDIIVYYNAQENEIEYLYGQENDISVRQIEYRSTQACGDSLQGDDLL
jgi:hypothetical protein